jgi:hypothetical protein
MANALKTLAVVELTDSYASAYTVPALTTFTCGMLHIVNRDTSQRTVTVLLRTGGSDLEAEAILGPDFPIAALDFVELFKGASLAAGTIIRAKADVTQKVNLFLSGIETT